MNWNILAYNTTDRGAHVVLLNDVTHFQRSAAGGEGPVESLGILTEEVLEDAQCDFQQITAISLCTGPGSFTGIRGALAHAQGMAAASRVDVYGVSYPLAYLISQLEMTSGLRQQFVAAICFPAAKNETFLALLQVSPEPARPVLSISPVREIVAIAKTDLARELEALSEEFGGALKIYREPADGGPEVSAQRITLACAQVARASLAGDIKCLSNEVLPILQSRSQGIGLLAIYGKGAAAKTLADRGLG